MISVIIPTHNAGEYIHRLIESLKSQSVTGEIIVIDSSSSDSTVQAAESYGIKTVVIEKKDFDHGSTRNIAVAHCTGDIFVFLTQDALPENSRFLENLIKPLENPLVAASYGRQIPGADARPPERFARIFNYPDTSLIKSSDDIAALGIKTFFFSNVSSAIRKKEFEAMGGFSESVIMNEDMLLAGRLILGGYKVAYVSEASVIHSHNYAWIDQFRRYFDIGVFMKKDLYPLAHIKADNTGFSFLKEEIGYLLRNKEYRWLPYIIGEALSKYAGYKLGMNYEMLPGSMRKKMSMHKGYW